MRKNKRKSKEAAEQESSKPNTSAAHAKGKNEVQSRSHPKMLAKSELLPCSNVDKLAMMMISLTNMN